MSAILMTCSDCGGQYFAGMVGTWMWPLHECPKPPRDVSPFGSCNQAGCDRPGNRPVLTNYGHLGNVCDEHYAEIARILPSDHDPERS